MPVKPRQVFAFSGILNRPPGQRRDPAFLDYAVSLATADGKKRVCFIPTATGDSPSAIEAVTEVFAGREDIDFTVLRLFTQPSVPDVGAHLTAQDVLLVGGGSVVNLMAVWRAHGLAPVMQQCWEAGVVLAGWSAGSLCWHRGGPTDSFGDSLAVFTGGLGLLPYSNGVHDALDDQPRRRVYRQYVANGELPAGYAPRTASACITSAPNCTKPSPCETAPGPGGWNDPPAVATATSPSLRAGSDRPAQVRVRLSQGGNAGSGQPGSLAHTRRLGDNAGMARDYRRAQVQGVAFSVVLDGVRPAGMAGWMSRVAPVVTQAAVGAGHWAAGRRQRALAAWASAAGYGLVAWGLGTEAPTLAEVRQNMERLQRDLLGKPVPKAPAATGALITTARHLSRYDSLYGFAATVVGVVIGVRWGLRHPRRLTVLVIASQAPAVVFSVLRAARAVQRRRPRIAAGSALVAAGSVARLRAASAEPLR